jgi:hypothetical protein
MALTEKTEFDVTVKASGHLEVRRSDVVYRDGEEIARTYHRHVVTPGDETANQIKLVQDIAQSVWTAEMIAAATAAAEAAKEQFAEA